MVCRVLIADEHALFRDGLRAILSMDKAFEVIAQAQDGHEALIQAVARFPDVISMDLLMPGMSGIEATRQIKRCKPSIRILAVTEQSSPDYVKEALMAGCDGYILKSSTSEAFVEAINFIRFGGVYIDPSISEQVVLKCLISPDNRVKNLGWNELTDKEQFIVRLVAEGHTNRSTAEILNKSVKTVEKLRSNLMAKLGLHGATALVVKAIDSGWVEKEHVGKVRCDLPPKRKKSVSLLPTTK